MVLCQEHVPPGWEESKSEAPVGFFQTQGTHTDSDVLPPRGCSPHCHIDNHCPEPCPFQISPVVRYVLSLNCGHRQRGTEGVIYGLRPRE